MPNTYDKIANFVAGTGSITSIEFAAIPTNYDDLIIKLSSRSNTSDGSLYIQFNSSTANFSWRRMLGSGSTTSGATGTDNYAAIIQRSTDTTSTFGNWEIYIPNYNSSTNKTFSVDAVLENNATDAIQMMLGGLRSNTAAITSITLSGASSMLQHTTATLYGIKKS